MEIFEIKIRGRTLLAAQPATLYGGESGVTELRFTGGDAALHYKLDFLNEWNGQKNTVDLTNTEGTLSVVLSGAAALPAGGYQVQLRTVGDTVWHSDFLRLTVRTPIDAVESIDPNVPSEMRQIEQRVTQAAEQAQTAAGVASSVRDMTVSAETLPEGEDAAVTKTEENGTLHMTFSIPRGAKGADASSARVFSGTAEGVAADRTVVPDGDSLARWDALRDGDTLLVRMECTLTSGTDMNTGLRLRVRLSGGETPYAPVRVGKTSSGDIGVPQRAWYAGSTIRVVYNAAEDRWDAAELQYARKDYLGAVRLSDAADSSSGRNAGYAATPYAVKQVNDQIAAKPIVFRVTGTMGGTETRTVLCTPGRTWAQLIASAENPTVAIFTGDPVSFTLRRLFEAKSGEVAANFGFSGAVCKLPIYRDAAYTARVLLTEKPQDGATYYFLDE